MSLNHDLAAFISVGTRVELRGALRRNPDHSLELEHAAEQPVPGPRLRLTDPQNKLSDVRDSDRVTIRAAVAVDALLAESVTMAPPPVPPDRFRGIGRFVPSPFDSPIGADVARLLFTGDAPRAAEWIPLADRNDSRQYIHYVLAYDVSEVERALLPLFGTDVRVVPCRCTAAQMDEAHATILRTDPANLESVGSRLDTHGQPVLTVHTLFPDATLQDLTASAPKGMVEYSSWVSVVADGD